MDESKYEADISKQLAHEQGIFAILALQDAIVKTLLQMVRDRVSEARVRP